MISEPRMYFLSKSNLLTLSSREGTLPENIKCIFNHTLHNTRKCMLMRQQDLESQICRHPFKMRWRILPSFSSDGM